MASALRCSRSSAYAAMLLRRCPEIKIKFLLSCGAQNATSLRGAEIYDTSSWPFKSLVPTVLIVRPTLRLEDYFERELDLPLRDRRSHQEARRPALPEERI